MPGSPPVGSPDAAVAVGRDVMGMSGALGQKSYQYDTSGGEKVVIMMLLGATKTPNKAVINEFIEIAKAFFPEGKEAKLVNGVLDNVLSKLQKTQHQSIKIS